MKLTLERIISKLDAEQAEQAKSIATHSREAIDCLKSAAVSYAELAVEIKESSIPDSEIRKILKVSGFSDPRISEILRVSYGPPQILADLAKKTIGFKSALARTRQESLDKEASTDLKIKKHAAFWLKLHMLNNTPSSQWEIDDFIFIIKSKHFQSELPELPATA